MIFHLGKGKTADDELVREETFRRWREASEKAQNQGTTQSKNQSAAENVSAAPSSVSQPTAPRISREIEEIQMDSMRAVEWPDPRSTISLTNTIETPELPFERKSTPAASSQLESTASSSGASASSSLRSISSEQPQKSPTARLAQFVSSGLSALGTTQKQAPVQKSNVEVLRTVDSNPLEMERQPSTAANTLTVKTTTANPSPSSAPQTSDTGVHLDEDIRRRFGANIRSALGPGTIIEGTFSFDSPVCIEGTLMGEVRSNSVLIVGPQATVNARVKVGTLIVFGVVHGDVDCEELVEIKSGGMLEGDVHSQRFALEDGAWFRGLCTPRSAPKKFGQVAEQTDLYDDHADASIDSFAAADKWTIGS